jgi:hypothetical protein
MKPEMLAVAILTLVTVAFAGAYIIKTSKSGIPEGFDAASRAAALTCEKSYNECLKAGSSLETCTKQSSVCLSAITNPSVSTATPAGSTGVAISTSAPSTRVADGTAGQPMPTPSADYQAAAAAALTGLPQTMSSEWDSFLKQVQTKVGSSAVKPTDQQLALVQGAGLTPTAPLDPTYKPSATIIKPHEKVPKQLPTMTASVGTDAGTKAQEIAMNNIYTPSIRQMIRDDVAQTVREEVEANQINNPYAVNYESY